MAKNKCISLPELSATTRQLYINTIVSLTLKPHQQEKYLDPVSKWSCREASLDVSWSRTENLFNVIYFKYPSCTSTWLAQERLRVQLSTSLQLKLQPKMCPVISNDWDILAVMNLLCMPVFWVLERVSASACKKHLFQHLGERAGRTGEVLPLGVDNTELDGPRNGFKRQWLLNSPVQGFTPPPHWWNFINTAWNSSYGKGSPGHLSR